MLTGFSRTGAGPRHATFPRKRLQVLYLGARHPDALFCEGVWLILRVPSASAM